MYSILFRGAADQPPILAVEPLRPHLCICMCMHTHHDMWSGVADPLQSCQCNLPFDYICAPVHPVSEWLYNRWLSCHNNLSERLSDTAQVSFNISKRLEWQHQQHSYVVFVISRSSVHYVSQAMDLTAHTHHPHTRIVMSIFH